MSKKQVYFWPHTTNTKVASFRLRCKLIATELIKFGTFNVTIGSKPSKRIDVLILSKRYDTKTLISAEEFKLRYGTRVILDICDNHFVLKSSDNKSITKRDQLITAINTVDQVVTSSDFLKKEILKYCNPISPVIVISDIVEINKYTIFNKLCRLNALFNFFKLKWTFSQNKCSRIIWFGNHQGSYKESGMSDLLRIKSELQFVSEELNLSLTILSNSRKKYNDVFRDWDIKTYYLEWDEVLFKEVLELHDLAVIPCSINDFTLSKSDNRVTTSLAHNLKVIADPVPSYLKYQEYIYIGDWKKSLKNCIGDSELKNVNYDVINHNYSIINLWLKLISN